MNATFQKLGFVPDYQHSSPDFVLKHSSGVQLVAEAVTANHAEGFRPEWDAVERIENYNPSDSHDIVDIATIRLSNAIATKYAKYQKSYAKLPHVEGKPFVLCVAPFEQPLFFIQNDNAIRRVLYGYDQPLLISTEDGGRICVGEAGIDSILKESGAEIPLGIFQSGVMPEISAVIFSNTATMTKLHALAKDSNVARVYCATRYQEGAMTPRVVTAQQKDYQETLLDGLHLFLNPYAKNPIDTRPFLNREMAIHTVTESGEWISDVPRDFLYQHMCYTFTHGDTAKGLAYASQRYKEYKRPQRIDEELRPVPGTVLTFVDNHLASYKGWSIVVCRDSIDDDWGGQAARGPAQTLAEYHRLNKDEMILPEQFYTTKEDAFIATKRMIDQQEGQATAG